MKVLLILACLFLLGSCATTDDLDSPAAYLPVRSAVEQSFDRMIANADREEHVIGSVYFPFDQADIPVQEAQTLMRIASELKRYEGTVLVEGHTDHFNTDEYNRRLGYRRAYNVAGYLRSAGVWDERLYVKTYGEARPAASNWVEPDRSQNRRVDVIVLAQGDGMAGKEAVRAYTRMFQEKTPSKTKGSGINLFLNNAK